MLHVHEDVMIADVLLFALDDIIDIRAVMYVLEANMVPC